MNFMSAKIPTFSPRTLWISATLSGLLCISGAVALYARSSTPSPSAPISPAALWPEHVRIAVKDPAVEGQPLALALTLQGLESNTPIPLTLRWKDTSYGGQTLARSLPLQWQGKALTPDVIFESPGTHTLEVLNSQSEVLKSLPIEVTPFPATVFPKKWEDHRNLPQDPSDWKLWANLYAEPKAAQGQRQYLQITHRGRIIDRFLVSSGAIGHNTPFGTFKLGFKEYYPRSRRYGNTPMPFWSAINVNGNEGEYGFHALEDGGYLHLLGTPASHGCIRLSRQASVETDPATGKKFWGDRGGARWIYDRVPEKAAVTIFQHKLPAFAFEDYNAWLNASWKAAQKPKTQGL